MGRRGSWDPPQSLLPCLAAPAVGKFTLNSSHSPFWLWFQSFLYLLARSLLARSRTMILDLETFWPRPTSSSSWQSNSSSWPSMLQNKMRGAITAGVMRLFEAFWIRSSKHFRTTNCQSRSEGYYCHHLAPGMPPPQWNRSSLRCWPNASTIASMMPRKSLNDTESL